MPEVTPKPIAKMGLIDLKQHRARLEAESRDLLGGAEKENRSLNASERLTFDGNLAAIKEVDGHMRAIQSIKEQAARDDAGHAGMESRGAEFNRYLAGELRDLSTGGAFTGALVPNDYQLYVWDRLAAKAVALSSGTPTVIQTERHTIELPHLLTDATAAWVAENGTISEADPTGEQISVTPTKIAALTKFSRESATDSNPAIAQIVGDNLMRSIALGIDLGFFEGTGSSNQPTGLKNTANITVQSMGTNGASPTNLDFLLTALATLEGYNADMSKVVIVAPARTVNDLFALKDSQNRYLMQSVTGGGASARSIEGVPIFTSNQLTLTETQGSSSLANSVYVYDSSQVIVVKAHDVRLEATNDAYFSTDEIGLRCIARVGFAVPNPKAVVRIEGVLA